MPGRSGWTGGIHDGGTPTPPPTAGRAERRAAARTVAAASTDLGDLRELLAMLGLDTEDRDAPDTGDVPRQRAAPLDPMVRRT